MLNISDNRKSKKWTRKELFLRVLWGLSFPLFRLSPRPLWGWRRFMLRAFGAKIGHEVHIFPTVNITIPWNLSVGDFSAIGDKATVYALGSIIIGSRTTISQGAHLCAGTHDIDRPDRPLIKAKILVGNDVWIAADAFLGPDICIGSFSIVGARAVVMKNVEENSLVVGNPAYFVKRLNTNEC